MLAISTCCCLSATGARLAALICIAAQYLWNSSGPFGRVESLVFASRNAKLINSAAQLGARERVQRAQLLRKAARLQLLLLLAAPAEQVAQLAEGPEGAQLERLLLLAAAAKRKRRLAAEAELERQAALLLLLLAALLEPKRVHLLLAALLLHLLLAEVVVVAAAAEHVCALVGAPAVVARVRLAGPEVGAAAAELVAASAAQVGKVFA